MMIPPILQLYRLRRQQWLRLDDLIELQRRKLKAILDYAYRNVKYYRKLFDSHGIAPAAIKNVSDLTQIPVTERRCIQRVSVDDIIATQIDLKGCRRILTSGSSGRPLMVFRTRYEDNLIDTVWARGFLEDGASVWDKNADYNAFLGLPKRWFEHFGIWRRSTIPRLASPLEQIRVLKQTRPDIIRGNPFELVNLALTMRREGIEGINPRLVFTMGSLLDQGRRDLIESVLSTKVFDFYGTTELGCVAWECSERKGYHINSDTVVLEVINDKGEAAGSGESGRVICTGLFSFAMPFIRYDLGDIGVVSEKSCPCGRGMPLLECLEGRAYDSFISTDGILHSPGSILSRVKRVRGIEQYKIIQENETKVTAQIVPDKNFSQETKEALERTFKTILGEKADIKVEIVNEIPYDSPGKVQSIVSKLKKDIA
jgi:phenylacetate-CoA ligase